MPQMTRNQLLANVTTSNSIMSATWARRVNKKVHLCPQCTRQTARHRKSWVCSTHGDVIPTVEQKSEKGDMVTLQFRHPIPANGTKNWTPAGGFMFNAATADEAATIRRNNGLIGILEV